MFPCCWTKFWPRSIPGRVEYKPVTLRYGLTDSRDMMRWLFAAVEETVGKAAPLAHIAPPKEYGHE